MKPRYDPKEMMRVYKECGQNASETARILDIPRSTLRMRLSQDHSIEDELEYSEILEEIDIDQLVIERKAKYERKAAYEKSTELITCKVKKTGPIGLLFFGDPHCDDDGCDIRLLEHYAHLTRVTDGLYGVNMGDTTNNWVGRLSHLWSTQSTSAQEAYELSKWFIGLVDWLFIIGGNHDAWLGTTDPVKWYAALQGTVHQNAALRMQLKFPKGQPIIINARHNFAGHSMWNAAHAVKKGAMFGFPDHIFIAGHRHTSGYAIHKQPNGVISHCIQVASFKIFDQYAKDRDMRDQRISSAVLTIIKPEATREADRVMVFHDIDAGCDYLKFLRKDL